jgi:L-asparaginase
VGVIKLYPGIPLSFLKCALTTEGLRAIVLETFGAGNASTNPEFIAILEQAIGRGLIVYNVTQCKGGSVELGKYQTSVKLKEIGVVSGHDITTEAAVTKLMFLLGQNFSLEETTKCLETNLRGELTR